MLLELAINMVVVVVSIEEAAFNVYSRKKADMTVTILLLRRRVCCLHVLLVPRIVFENCIQ